MSASEVGKRSTREAHENGGSVRSLARKTSLSASPKNGKVVSLVSASKSPTAAAISPKIVSLKGTVTPVSSPRIVSLSSTTSESKMISLRTSTSPADSPRIVSLSSEKRKAQTPPPPEISRPLSAKTKAAPNSLESPKKKLVSLQTTTSTISVTSTKKLVSLTTKKTSLQTKPKSVTITTNETKIVSLTKKAPAEDPIIVSMSGTFVDTDEKRMQRAARFHSQSEAPHMASEKSSLSPGCVSLSAIKTQTMRGTCQALEKRYHRENAKEANPSEVRPAEVLVKSLQMVKRRWIDSGDYTYCCDQLKAIQQDLMLQQIETPLTIDAYESHARLALEQADWHELTRCQLRLTELYGRKAPVGKGDHRMEFTAYKLLTLLHDKQDSFFECTRLLKQFTPTQSRDPDLSFAIRVVKSFFSQNFSEYWVLYRTAPKMAAYAMDKISWDLRFDQLQTHIKSQAANIPVSFLSVALGFNSDSDCTRYLRLCRCVFADRGNIDPKLSKERLQPATIRYSS